MKDIKKFNSFSKVSESLDNEPYLHMIFNINLRAKDDNPDGILKSPPIRGIKNIKKWSRIINHTNTFLSSIGKNVYIEKHNFETMEDLDKWLEDHPE